MVTTNRVILVTEELEAPGIINESQVFVIAYHRRIDEDNSIRVQVTGTLGTANTKVKIKFVLSETEIYDHQRNEIFTRRCNIRCIYFNSTYSSSNSRSSLRRP